MNPQRRDIATAASWTPAGVSNLVGMHRRRGLAS